jgi:hypothetical protein
MLITRSKSLATWRFCRKTMLVAMVGLFCLLTTLDIWTHPAAGADSSTAELQKSESRMLSARGPGMATNLQVVTARCDPVQRIGVVELSWEPARTPGSQQRLDMTMFRDGFRTGQFTTLGPLPPDQSEVELSSGEPNINYAWRVLTLTAEGWEPSETAHFMWPGCPGTR